MKNIVRNVAKLGFVVFAALSITQGQQALAGWGGLMNGGGVGFASVNVRSSKLQTNFVTTFTNTASPSATIPPTSGYKTNAPLPSTSATNTYARIKGLPGGIWQAALGSTNSGDGLDNPELESKVSITPADCVSLTFESAINQTQSDPNSGGLTGTISVNATATAGTALWLRGFEYTNSMADVPADDPNTVENEAIEYLKTHGVLRFETLLVGPFEFGGANNNTCPLIVPFSLSSGNISNLVFATDAVGKSYPLAVICPDNIYAYCGTPVVYPPLNYSACGDVTIVYNPPDNAPTGTLFPLGTTPVTVTISDNNGNSTNCTFTVTVLDATPPDAPVLPVLTNQCSVLGIVATAIDSCTGTITGTTTDPTNYTSQGTYTVHWSFSDSSGNTTNANQTVIVKDTIPPVAPVLTVLSNQCSVQVPTPTATDDCAGMVMGTTTDPTNYNNQGTYTVHWSFSDGHGNTSMANQTVIVKDTIPPVARVLPTLTGSCSAPVVLTAPTTTDNCAGIVTGTTSDLLNSGTNIVHWSFSDGHGNTSTATQTVIVTGLTLRGFYSPISTINNACTSPVIINQGSVLPIKFDVLCGSSSITTGQAPIVEIQLWTNCSFVNQPITVNAVFQNDWHYNWDTSRWAKGIYKVVVILPDGTTNFAFVKLK